MSDATDPATSPVASPATSPITSPVTGTASRPGERPEPTDGRGGLIPAAPLVLAYLLLPASWGLARHFPSLRLPQWMPDGWPWLALAAMGLLGSLLATARRRRAGGRTPGWAVPLLAAGGVLMALGAVKWGAENIKGPFFPQEQFWLLALPELAPLAFGLLAGTWVLSFGAPAPKWFRRLGALLGLLALADALLTSGMVGYPVPGGLLLDGAHAETRALLLGLALLLGVDDADRAGAFPHWQTLPIMAGILVCGSPVVLMAAGAGYLFLSRVRLEARVGFALACAGGVVAPFYGFSAASMDGRMQLYMTWLAGWESFAAHPLALLKGFGPWPLDLRLPEEAAALLGLPDMAFSLPPRAVPAFWMRAALVWGALPPAVLFLTSVALTAVSPGRAMAAIMTLALAQGAVAPLFYDASCAVALCLAVACLLAQATRALCVECSMPAAPEPAKDENTAEPDDGPNPPAGTEA